MQKNGKYNSTIRNLGGISKELSVIKLEKLDSSRVFIL